MNYLQHFTQGIRPEPLLSVSQWADQHRMLSQTASSEPGRWRTDRTPYLREIMDCLSTSSPTERVVFMKGAQIGGTEAGNNWVGYIIDQSPGPLLVVQPTVEMGKRWSKGRLAPLIDQTPCLRSKIKEARARDSGNTVQSKEFQGGLVVITGANSAVGLRSMPVRYLFLDEVDAYPGDADGEGDPVSLAIQRTATFARRKIFMVSTPTIQGVSRIEMEYEYSDQRQYYVPCPHCGHMQTLVWQQIHYDDGVYYACVECGKRIDEFYKSEMLRHGKWIAKHPERTTAGFHLSSLYSPVGWFSWKQAVENFKRAEKNETLLKVWVNTTLGETWTDRGDAPDWERLFERAEEYPRGTVPKGGLVLTAGVDVQKDRLECEIVAWGENRESWSVDYIIIQHGPSTTEAWKELTRILDDAYPVEGSDQELSISMMAIDTGYSTQEVYNWVRAQGPHRAMAVKGVATAMVPLGTPHRIDVTRNGKRLSRGAKLWPVGVSLVKSELYAWLKKNKPRDEESKPGYMHFPKYDSEFFKQLTAEQLVTKMVKGYTKREWQKTRDRNEALDCRVYARAASMAIGIDRWSQRRWDQLKNNLKTKSHTQPDDEGKTPSERIVKRIVRSSWLNR